MNLFLPEKTVYDSVRALDDKRLIKQILECKTILDVALDESKKGYAKHPVVKYYSVFPNFVATYGYIATIEYYTRFKKDHSLQGHFCKYVGEIQKKILVDAMLRGKNLSYYPKPFYCEGSKTDPNCIRTTENTVELFRNKLCKKWDNDKYPPKWTNRQPPEWYKNKR